MISANSMNSSPSPVTDIVMQIDSGSDDNEAHASNASRARSSMSPVAEDRRAAGSSPLAISSATGTAALVYPEQIQGLEVLQIENDIAAEFNATNEQNKLANLGLPPRAFLDTTVMPLLMEGIKAVVRVRPPNPCEYLGLFLIKNSTHCDSDIALHSQIQAALQHLGPDFPAENNEAHAPSDHRSNASLLGETSPALALANGNHFVSHAGSSSSGTPGLSDNSSATNGRQ